MNDVDPQPDQDGFAALLHQVRDTTELDVTFGGSVSATSSVRQYEHVLIDTFSGDGMEPLAGLGVVAGTGLGGKVLAMVRPATVVDYECAGGITHHYDWHVAAANLRAVLALPIAPRGKPRAVLYGALRTPVSFGDDVVAAAQRAVRGFEAELLVADEVNRRVAELTSTDSLAGAQEELRDVYAELRAIAATVSDVALRERLERLCARVPGQRTSTEHMSAPVLSRREVDVLAQAACGLTNAEIAERLGVVPSTVKAYLKHAMRKLDTRNRVEAVRAARRFGIIP
ncbi:regulatory LuxR family protein [Tamaricihabitans halophyticus]|uniref:Regulatory LuxR family protein n=1 Tax=Tamaricihabitans halophyticus TaxID=1262583 RepID=A0A4R2Q9G4_9PSEU|nr:LuxR C-terminal-related transcriptional regulator [Tamaricihabitans halophyticus]TCP43395.1 regulatory LuxR family protein [Tamaricihabitans halophyticus]